MNKKSATSRNRTRVLVRGRRTQSPLNHGAIGVHMHRDSSINLSIRWLTRLTVTVNHWEFNEKLTHFSILIRLFSTGTSKLAYVYKLNVFGPKSFFV